MKGKSRRMLAKRRISALVTALAVAFTLVCVPQTMAEAAATETYLELKEENNSTSVPLEIGDTVSMKLAFTAAAGAYTDVESLHAKLVYDTKRLEISGVQSEAGWKAICNGEKIAAASESGSGRAASGTVATITFRVKKAVESSTTVVLNEVQIFRMHNVVLESLPTACEVTNAMGGSRTVSFAMPGPLKVPMGVGETGRLPIRLQANSGFTTLHLKVAYIPTLLVYEGFELSAEARSAQVSLQTVSITSTGSQNEISLCFVAQGDIRITGDFAYIDFSANRAGGASTSVSGAYVTASVYAISNESETTMTASPITPCEIKFTNAQVVLGDVNNDGSVNLIDAAWALQAYNGVREITPELEKRADVNRSGSLTLVDVLLIMKYYNGEITQFPTAGT